MSENEMARANEDGDSDEYAQQETADEGEEGGGDDAMDMLELFLAELDALERHGKCVSSDDDAMISSLGDTTGGSTTKTTGVVVTSTVAAAKKPPAVKKSPRKRKRSRPTGAVNTHYKRQKEELVALRAGVDALKSQLEMLHARQRSQRPSNTGSASRSVEDDHVTPAAAAGERSDEDDKKRALSDLAKLKECVAHELDSRQQVKLENTRLRKLAEDAREFTRSMEGAFAKHPTPAMVDLFDVSPALRVVDSTDPQVYRELESCLDARYAGASLMREGFGRCPGTGNFENDLRAISVLVKNDQDASVLLNNSRVMPFSVQLINEVVWRGNNIGLLHARNAAIKVIQRFESSVFLSKQYKLLDRDDKEVVMTLQTVFRRYVDKNRVYMAWESVGEWPGSASSVDESDTNTKFVIREHGWGSVLPFPDPTSRSTVSTLHASTIVAPNIVGNASAADQLQHRKQAQQLSDAVAPTHQVAFAARMQQLENMLLDHSIRSSRCG